jgi:hypothetical protein
VKPGSLLCQALPILSCRKADNVGRSLHRGDHIQRGLSD